MNAARIVQVANFVAPHSGGIRTVLGQLAAGYAAAGHDVVQVVPGDRARCELQPWGRRLVLPGRPVPGTGYRVLAGSGLRAVLARHQPDRLEVHDRSTLRWLGGWARRHGVPSVLVSHERLDRLIRQWLPGEKAGLRLADASNRRLAGGFDYVVCTTSWAAAEFARLPAGNLRLVPLGVDLERFHPPTRPAPDPASIPLAMVSRLSVEKRPSLAIETVAELGRRGVAVHLRIAGEGPLRERLRARAAGLPVDLLGHVPAADVPALLGSAEAVLAPGPVETFGLAAVEALACGTPVVANAASALPGIVGTAGLGADETPAAFADAVVDLLRRPRAQRRRVARERAELYPWSATVEGMLAVHGLERSEASA